MRLEGAETNSLALTLCANDFILDLFENSDRRSIKLLLPHDKGKYDRIRS
jgi:hypothetical protein